MMRYDGQVNSPGVPGNSLGVYGDSLAGTWIRDPFQQGQQPEADQLFRRGINGTSTEQRIKNLRDLLRSNPGAIFGPQAMSAPNMMPMGNAGFFTASPLEQLAQNQGPSTPVKYDEQMKVFVPNPGAGRPGNIRYKNVPGV